MTAARIPIPLISVLILAHTALAEPVPEQGTWESSLQPRDLDGDGVTDAYYDVALDITWVADADLKTTLEWHDGQSDGGWPEEEFADWLAGFGYLGVTTWRLPTPYNPNQGETDGELEHMYAITLGNKLNPDPDAGLVNTGPFQNLLPTQYLYNTGVDIGGLGGDIYADTFNMAQGINYVPGPMRAWAVADGDVQPVNMPPPAYEVVDLGTLRDGSYSFAEDINNSGQVVGWADNHYGRPRAFIYEDARMRTLGTLKANNSGESRGYGINEAGQVTGYATATSPELGDLGVGFLYDGSEMAPLAPLPSTPNENYILSGQAIGNGGDIAVAVSTSFGNERRFGVLKRDGTLLVDPDPDTYGAFSGNPARDINADGIAIGIRESSFDYFDFVESVVLADDQFNVLGRYTTNHLDGDYNGYQYYAINDNGKVAGSFIGFYCGSNFCDPIDSYGVIGSASDIPAQTGDSFERLLGTRSITDINNNDDILGTYTYARRSQYFGTRYLIRPAGGYNHYLHDLVDTSGWDWASARFTAMNDSLDIAGTIKNPDGEYRAILLRNLGPARVIEIDVLPGAETNIIYPNKAGELPVAILSDGEFDAVQINPATVRIGPQHSPALGWPTMADVDGANGADSILEFEVSAAGIQCNEPEITLIGRTWSGEPVRGTDSIDTSQCDEGGCHAY